MRVGIERHDFVKNVLFDAPEGFATGGPITVKQWFTAINGLNGGVVVTSNDIGPDIRQKIFFVLGN